MPKTKHDSVARQERAKRRLGTRNPVCCLCRETDWRCMEAHHIAGQAHHDNTVQICRNCHRKLSDAQKDHPATFADPKSMPEIIGYYLLGLADLLVLLVERLTEFGKWLIENTQTMSPGGSFDGAVS